MKTIDRTIQQALEQALKQSLPDWAINGLSGPSVYITLYRPPSYVLLIKDDDTITIYCFEKTIIDLKKYDISNPKIFTSIAKQVIKWHKQITKSRPNASTTPSMTTNPCCEIKLPHHYRMPPSDIPIPAIRIDK